MEANRRTKLQGMKNADVDEALRHVDLLQGSVDQLHRMHDETVVKHDSELAALKDEYDKKAEALENEHFNAVTATMRDNMRMKHLLEDAAYKAKREKEFEEMKKKTKSA